MATKKIERTQKLFLKALKTKFAEDPQAKETVFAVEGLKQSPRKMEFVKAGQKVAMERGISAYDPVRCHLGGIPLGQRQLMSYEVSRTGVFVEGDDLHFVNNAAMQQMWDDIRRTIIVGLDLAHQTLQKRLGKEVTPETINEYLHVLNHAMPGAAVVQEHMVETHPALVMTVMLRYSLVTTRWPTTSSRSSSSISTSSSRRRVQRHSRQQSANRCGRQSTSRPSLGTCDGGTTSRWSAMQIGMSFIGAYHMCAGEAAVADLAFAAKHAGIIQMATSCQLAVPVDPTSPVASSSDTLPIWFSQTGNTRTTPVKASLEIVAAGTMLFDQIWLGSYMSGGVGFTQYATAAYTDNILDDFTCYGIDYVKSQVQANCTGKVQPKQDAVTTSHPKSPCMVWSNTNSSRLHSRTTSAVPSVHPFSPPHPVSQPHSQPLTPTLVERMVHVHAPAQGRLVTSRILRLRSAGPVWFRKHVRLTVPTRVARTNSVERTTRTTR